MNIKKNKCLRLLSGMLAAVVLIVAVPVNVKADVSWPQGLKIDTPSAIVMDVNSGTILYEKNSKEKNYPASITKIMTTLLALENSELNEVVTFSDNAINLNQGDTSHIARDYGEEMTMEECLYAVMLESANECSYAVAEHVGQKLGGDYHTFIDLMNEKAEELGCVNTHFNNSNGLPDKEHWVSAYDMALISAEAYQNEMFRKIIGSRKYQIPPTNKHDEITYLNNHHSMISNYKTTKYLYEYCKGGKTGYTNAAKHTLVTFAEKDGLTLVCVVMHTSSGVQYEETRKLFDYCFQNFQSVLLSENEALAGVDKSLGIMNNNLSFIEMEETASVLLPINANVSDMKSTIIKEGLPKGTIARLEYTYGDRVVGTVDLIPSGASVNENYFDHAANLKDEEQISVIRIKPLYILLGVIGVVLVFITLFVMKYMFDNYYVIRHDMHVKKERKRRLRTTSKRRRRRKKRDSMFR